MSTARQTSLGQRQIIPHSKNNVVGAVLNSQKYFIVLCNMNRSLLRIWQADPSSGLTYLSSVSTELPEVLAEGIRVHTHICLYLLEPTGIRKTRLTHLCRTDTR